MTGGGIQDGELDASNTLLVYAGTISANLGGTAELEKLGPGVAVLGGLESYQGGTNAVQGTLVVWQQSGLPGTTTGDGIVFIQPTLVWAGGSDWATGQWTLADGTPSPWIDGSNVVIPAGAEITMGAGESVSVTDITFEGNAEISGGTINFTAWGGAVAVDAGTATVTATLTGSSGLTESGPGELIVSGAGLYRRDNHRWRHAGRRFAPAFSARACRRDAIGPGTIFDSTGTSLAAIDPAIFNEIAGLVATSQSIGRTDMMAILSSAIVDGSVSPAALDALEAITTPQGEAALNVPNYVAVLAADVVQGNPANETYQGQPLGDLASQPTGQAMATALNDLVGKWFWAATRRPLMPMPLRPAPVTPLRRRTSSATTRIRRWTFPVPPTWSKAPWATAILWRR